MKRLGLKRDKPRIEDVLVIREIKPVKKWRRFALTIAVVIAAATAFWPAYLWYLKPQLDERQFEAALTDLVVKYENNRKYVEFIKAQPRERMLLIAFNNWKSFDAELDDKVRIAGARAALDLAIGAGSEEAGLELGKALRDGVFGTKDSVAALREFDRVRRNIEPGVRAGDATALYVHAIMLFEGLGVNLDRKAAIAAMTRAGDGLKGWRLEVIANDALKGSGVFEGNGDAALASRLASRLMDAGDHSAYSIGRSSCDRLMGTDGELDLENRNARALKKEQACERQWISRAANAGNKSAMAEFASILLTEEGNLTEAKKWYEAAGSERSTLENYEYGLVQAIAADDVDALFRGVKLMWTAVQEDKGSEYPRIRISSGGVHSVLRETEKAVAGSGKSDERRNLAIALLVQAELADTMQETVKAVRIREYLETYIDARQIRRTDSLDALIKSPPNVQTASLIAEAIRSNRMYVSSESPPGSKTFGSGREVAASSQPDPEQQSRSGYLPGAQEAASGGLSTFTVDNAQGGRDSVVRLYPDGKKPAMRSFYIKRGDKFTARSLLPGTYVMRYRFIGSDDTFEAEKRFVLTETKTEDGRRFSNVTVTLFQERDGNLSTKKVPPEEF